MIPRAVRDVSKAIGKKVKLEIVGEELRVDTSIAEVLNNSVLHIVKNSVDHGLEKSEIRVAAGKPEAGNVAIKCSMNDDRVLIEIQDDGGGINIEAIKSKMLKNGTHTPEQIALMQEGEIHQMIFASGFSTAAVVTDISGRGVGMSMVKDSVESIGGEIQIESATGKGSLFRLVLPVPKSVMISSCLGVRARDLQVGLVRDDIVRVLLLDRDAQASMLRSLEGSRSLLLDGHLVPLVHLGDVLSGAESGVRVESEPLVKIIVLEATKGGARIGLQVDSILDVEDTVIKAVHPTLNPGGIFRGATFLEDGQLGLVLNTVGIFERIGVNPARKRIAEVSAAAKLGQATSAIDSARPALIFKVGHEGLYAIEQNEVFRIEQIDPTVLKHSGFARVMPYRDSILEIRDVDQVFEKTARPVELAECPPSFVFVIQRGNKYFGLAVDQIVDATNVCDLKTDLAQPVIGIIGHFFNDGKTVALFSVDQVLNILKPTQGRASQFDLLTQDAEPPAVAA